MKAIKIITILITLSFIWTCSNDDVNKTYSNTNGEFVRFFMLVNSNNDVLQYPQVNGGLQPVSEYTKDNIKTLKIPVALTSAELSGNVTVNYEALISGLSGVTIQPQNNVTFTPTKLVDTIFVNFTERWDIANNPELKFTLLSASDPNITIGMPNNDAQNDVLTIDFDALNFTYRFPSPNQKEIIGSAGETVNFSVEFPDGYLPSEINATDLISETSSNFGYTLSEPSFTNSSQVDYTLTVVEDIQLDELEFRTVFQLNDLMGYTVNGSTNYTIKKPIVTIRDNSVYTANQFINLSDQFHRTYGEHWFDSNEDGVCSWQAYFAFTYPVIVESTNPNAVLFDDMGTPDTADDVYHHAFRIGFNSPNTTGTTNSFDLRRWFDNESSNQANSPGFNIPEALEFYPTNGTSTTGGFIQVIEQDLLISSNTGTQHIISISGNGTYSEISPGLFEILLEFNATNNELFGGTRTDIYRIYSNNSYTEPAPLTDGCNIPIDL
ncbi:hypothetical protein [Winogradskyella schleiferi]|uniref:hypothetical protein n=1 Tax=Winogradskyella schleiferi TaxID=2686078 RepID=UPI0015C1A6EC|nr:hypothetical protein [Winogradskyella schleiferi]